MFDKNRLNYVMSACEQKKKACMTGLTDLAEVRVPVGFVVKNRHIYI